MYKDLNLQKQLLKSIQSYIELEKISNIEKLTSKISDIWLSQSIKRLIKQLNFGLISEKIDDYLYNSKAEIFIYELDDIKKFPFEIIEIKNIDEIKNLIGIKKLVFFSSNYGNKEKIRHWDNKNRVAVICNKKLADTIKKNPKSNMYVIKTIKTGTLGYYTEFEFFSMIDYKLKTTQNEYYDTRYEDREIYDQWYLDAYENDESNFWNND